MIRIEFFDERSRLPSDEEAEVTVTDIAVKILELSKPLLEFGHETCEQVCMIVCLHNFLYISMLSNMCIFT